MREKLFFIFFAFIILIFSICFSCNPKGIKEKFVDINREVIIKNKVRSKTTIKIWLDSLGKPLWSRPEAIDYFNNLGLKTMTVSPKYVPGQPEKPPPDGYTLEQLGSLRAPETNIPNGDSDTSFYEYDSMGNLTFIKNKNTEIQKLGLNFIIVSEHVNTTKIKYDKNNNWTEKCFSSDINEDV